MRCKIGAGNGSELPGKPTCVLVPRGSADNCRQSLEDQHELAPLVTSQSSRGDV